MSARPLAVAGPADDRPALALVDPFDPPAPQRSMLVWRSTLALAEAFDQRHLFAVVLQVLRTARHDVGTITHALAIGHSHLSDHRGDLVAWRAAALLGQAIAFLGGQERPGGADAPGPRR